MNPKQHQYFSAMCSCGKVKFEAVGMPIVTCCCYCASCQQAGFAEAPAKMNHYAWAETETIIKVHGQGPFAITYVAPKDDPSK